MCNFIIRKEGGSEKNEPKYEKNQMSTFEIFFFFVHFSLLLRDPTTCPFSPPNRTASSSRSSTFVEVCRNTRIYKLCGRRRIEARKKDAVDPDLYTPFGIYIVNEYAKPFFQKFSPQ